MHTPPPRSDEFDFKSYSRFTKTLFASSLGSLLAITFQNPILTVKVHLQKARLDKELYTSVPRIPGIVHSIYATRGLRGFWAGLPMGLMQSVPSTGLFMLTFEEAKHVLSEHLGQQSALYPIIPGIGGAMARACSATLITPIELIRTIQASGMAIKSVDLMKDLFKKRGFMGFYLGLRATLSRDVPYTFIYWQSYQSLKDRALPEGIQNLGSMSSVFASAAISASIAAVITHPYDVLKTHQQVNIKELTKDIKTDAELGQAHHRVQRGPIHVCDDSCSSVIQLYNRGGLKACFRGLSMRLAMVIPGSAIMITVYESVKTFVDIV